MEVGVARDFAFPRSFPASTRVGPTRQTQTNLLKSAAFLIRWLAVVLRTPPSLQQTGDFIEALIAGDLRKGAAVGMAGG